MSSLNPSKPVRAFLAIYPEEHVLEPLSSRLERLRGIRAIKWVKLSQMHFTLAFLGNIEKQMIDRLASVGRETARLFEPFTIKLEGLGSFPPKRQPRVVWVGISQGAEVLERLARTLSEELEKLGFAREDRPFRAHLTLGRVKKRLSPAERSILHDEVSHPLLLGESRVREFVLVQSILRPEGPQYLSLETFGLEEQS